MNMPAIPKDKKEQQEYSKKLRKLKVVMSTVKKIPPTNDPVIYQKPNHKLSLEEFKSLFVKEALKRTDCKTIRAVHAFLEYQYERMIKEAMEQMKDVSEEGINSIRFRNEESKALVKRYFKQKGMSQFS